MIFLIVKKYIPNCFKSSDSKYFLNANKYFNNNKNIIRSNLITNSDIISIEDTDENILIKFVFNDIIKKMDSGSFYENIGIH